MPPVSPGPIPKVGDLQVAWSGQRTLITTPMNSRAVYVHQHVIEYSQCVALYIAGPIGFVVQDVVLALALVE